MTLRHSIDEGIGTRLRHRRMTLGLSTGQLAVTLGIAETRVQDWETGRAHIEAAELRKIADVLSVPPIFFFKSAHDR